MRSKDVAWKRRGGRRLGGAVSIVTLLALSSCSGGDDGNASCGTPGKDGGEPTGKEGGTSQGDAQGMGSPGAGNPRPDAGHRDASHGETVPDGSSTSDSGAGIEGAYHVSNLPGTPLDVPDAAADNVINHDCVLDTSEGTIGCPGTNDTFAFSFHMIDQPAGGRAALFVMKSLRVAQAAQLRIAGGSPAIVYALDGIVIDGTISGVSAFQPAGGFVQDDTGHGGGPGGGEALLGYDAAGGGSYCGVGGKGGPGSGGPPRAGGKVYGTPEIVPLIGGSSGGGGPAVDSAGGSGGAALQLSAGRSIIVSLGGVINVGGHGGRANAGAGGSGGSLVLEAPTVTVRGTLAANGGGGALSNGGSPGQSGQPTAEPALGSAATAGAGSAGKTKDGGDGSGPPDGGTVNDAGGGGGGAGRIRINTSKGTADITGATISPDPATGCATVGKLNR